MLILGIETSCDETGAAIVEGKHNSTKVKLLSNVVVSSLPLHSQSGGIIPENAAREQLKFIIPVIKKALLEAGKNIKDIDAVAVTHGPGLIGSLLIGVETAKTLSFVWDKPLIPISHLLGHVYANFIETELSPNIDFPAVALIVSGGHTDLIFMKQPGNIQWLGGTRDDAAGEALDKIGRLLSIPYPGGPYIEKAAKNGNENKYKFPKPMIDSDNFDFSFSGLKTAVLREVKSMKQPALPADRFDNEIIADVCASVQKAITDVLVKKTLKAAKEYNAESILLGGGVAANQTLRDKLELEARSQTPKAKIFAPSKNLCTDNAAMIGAAAFFNNRSVSWQKIDANPSLYF